MAFEGNAETSITIADIARELGVSKSTVSRVINGKGRIGNETRKRVLSFVNEHNYTPNPIAKGLAQKRTYNAAVVIPRDADSGEVPFFQNCLIGITETISERGFDALLAITDSDDINPLKRLVSNHKVDGVILTRLMENDIAVDYLQQKEIPFVVMGTAENGDFYQVDSDQEAGCADITKHMISRGCSRMTVLAGEQRNLVNQRRWEGFARACRETGTPEGKVVWNLKSQEQVLQILPELMKENPQCLVCMDDTICLWAIVWLKQNDYQIPEDVQVISFYDSPVLENNTPPVTALSVNVQAMSRKAGNLLVDTIEGRESSSKVKVKYELKIRESSR